MECLYIQQGLINAESLKTEDYLTEDSSFISRHAIESLKEAKLWPRQVGEHVCPPLDRKRSSYCNWLFFSKRFHLQEHCIHRQ